MVKEIFFYSNKDAYKEFSNFYRSLQIVDDLAYETNEHYYQAMKGRTDEIQNWIRLAPNPFLAKSAGRLLRAKKEFVDNWEDMKIDVMRKGLMAKFRQNPNLKKQLLETGDAILHEDSPDDLFWGVKGKDMLGKLLMELREILLKTE